MLKKGVRWEVWTLRRNHSMFSKLRRFAESQTSEDAVPEVQQQEKSERGEKTAENIRYGEAISEHGFGGETTGNSGEANLGM